MNVCRTFRLLLRRTLSTSLQCKVILVSKFRPRMRNRAHISMRHNTEITCKYASPEKEVSWNLAAAPTLLHT